MKKNYIVPSVNVKNIDAESLLAASLDLNGQIGGTQLSKKHGKGTSNNVNSVQTYCVWDDEIE